MRTGESALFWRESVLAVVNVTMSISENVVVTETSLSTIRSFIILRSGKGLTSFNEDNSANFSG